LKKRVVVVVGVHKYNRGEVDLLDEMQGPLLGCLVE
jgi:hypothetical protein